MIFLSRNTHAVLTQLASRLEQPDQASTPLSSNNPLLRRILASVEQALQARESREQQVRALTADVNQLAEQLAHRDGLLRQWEARWALISQGAGELFWELALDGTAAPAPHWSEQLHPADQQPYVKALGRHLADRSGRTPFALDVRMKPAAGGDYHWCRISLIAACAIGGPLASALMRRHRVTPSCDTTLEVGTLHRDEQHTRLDYHGVLLALRCPDSSDACLQVSFCAPKAIYLRPMDGAVCGIYRVCRPPWRWPLTSAPVCS